MSFIKNVTTLTQNPASKLLHAVPTQVPNHELGTVDVMDRGGRWAVNGATTAATMLFAAPVVAGIGLGARVLTSNMPLPFKALVVPAVPLGAAVGLVSGLINAVADTGIALVGAAMVVGGAVGYPVQTVAREISAHAN
jgi:hypothetical protein